jgi:hypothetical protein
MAELKNKVQYALDEARMLLIGAQALIGFGFRSAFEPGFDKLPPHSRYLRGGSLCLLLLALALLVWPAAYHRIVARGEDTPDVHGFVTKVMDWALAPFLVALAIDIYVASLTVTGHAGGSIVAGAVAGTAAVLWYGLRFVPGLRRRRSGVRGMSEDSPDAKESETRLSARIGHLLTEARMTLPGAQALLGFQFVTFLAQEFEALPAALKYVHLASLLLVTLTVVLLIAPAAYHRMVERGEETERFHTFASRMILLAMIPLALGVCGDFFIVVWKITDSYGFAAASSALMLCVFFGCWFGYTAWRRSALALRR